MREAQEQGIRDIRVLYTKAEGLIYRIGLPDQPFLVGGDYDGARPATEAEAKVEFHRLLPHHPNIRWFAPFMERIAAGEEFALGELLKFGESFKIYRFGEKANWTSGTEPWPKLR